MDRGRIGRLQRPPTLEVESYHDFCTTVRDFVFSDLTAPAAAAAQAAIDQASISERPDLNDSATIQSILKPVPPVAVRSRVLRSVQEMTWARIRVALYDEEAEFDDQLASAENAGPGSLSLDPELRAPPYTAHEFHIQPGGYGDEKFAGAVYHHGTNVFYQGMNHQDEVHFALADFLKVPEDGSVNRILDLGCSVGQGTVALKEAHPQAEVWGIDVAAPQLRYGHKRASDLDVNVNFAQRLAEDTKFPDSHFDVVNAFILFHEVPESAAIDIIKEAYRVLRPGGVFNVFDLPTEQTNQTPYIRFVYDLDRADNGEAFAPDFVRSDFRALLRAQGFEVEKGPRLVMVVEGLYCTKRS